MQNPVGRCRSAGQLYPQDWGLIQKKWSAAFTNVWWMVPAVNDAIVQNEQLKFLHILPSHIDLVGAEVEMVSIEAP
jgi:hypothetical protein